MNTASSPIRQALGSIRREWDIALSALVGTVVLSLAFTPAWMPLVEVAAGLLLRHRAVTRDTAHGQPCSMVLTATAWTLITTAAVSTAILIAHKTEYIDNFFNHESLNHNIPFITSLIIFPLLGIICRFMSGKTYRRHHMERCDLHMEYNPSQSLYGMVCHDVYRKMLLLMSTLGWTVSMVDWAYYLVFYRNVNINTPDRFFFIAVPVILSALTIVYVRRRFAMVLLPSGADAGTVDVSGKPLADATVLRFLVLRNNALLLDTDIKRLEMCDVDTPATVILPGEGVLTADRARREFERLATLGDFALRELYTTHNAARHVNVSHYMVFIPDGDPVHDRMRFALPGEWMTLDRIDRLIKMGVTAPALSAEIFRIYTMTMAWKTYNPDGTRRYPIKNYRPTFRLEDFKQWDLDYNDQQWLRLARINQDRRLWKIRRIFTPHPTHTGRS